MPDAYENLEAEAPKYNPTLWAMSLADLLSILLTFFVMLFAYSNPNFTKMKAAVDGVKDKFSSDMRGRENLLLNTAPEGSEMPLKLYYAETKKYVMQELQIDETSIEERGNMLIFRLPVDLLFLKGTAQIDDKRLFLKRMADGLTQQNIGKQLDIQFMIGRDQPGPKEKVPLSVLRAGAFARKMVEMGVPEDTVYTGLGESDPQFFNITFSPRDETRAKLEF